MFIPRGWRTPIHYYFVFNDKYKGTYPEIAKLLLNFRKWYSNITFDIMLTKAEDIFMGLREDGIIDIIGNIPDPMRMVQLLIIL